MARLAVSFEFFPPASAEGLDKLEQVATALLPFAPEFFSVTFGAGGSTRERTSAAVERLLALGVEVAPHLSAIGATESSVDQLLAQYQSWGIKRLVVLRGDWPSGLRQSGRFAHAQQLVAYIRQHPHPWHISVAGYPEIHPEANNAHDDLWHLKQKVEAGAQQVITQYFFNGDAYARFIEETQRLGIAASIIPGIMPIGQWQQLQRFSDRCGAEIPRWISQRLMAYGEDKKAIEQFGLEVVQQLIEQLIQHGAQAVHFYTLNRLSLVNSLCRNLKL